jgi:hypothetical protein
MADKEPLGSHIFDAKALGMETTLGPAVKLGSFEEELAKMIERGEKARPFPEGEVIILGMGATRITCPFDAETWSLNMGYHQVAELQGHTEKIFMAHGQTYDIRGRPFFNFNHINKLVEAGIEVWNIHKTKGLNSKLFPLNRLIKKYGSNYFSNTVAYMIIWALEKGYKKLRFYGVDMMTQDEYAWEKGGIEFWIGYAMARGVKVEICEGSRLLQTITGKPYGIKYWRMKDIDPLGLLKRKRPIDVIREAEQMQPAPWVKMNA